MLYGKDTPTETLLATLLAAAPQEASPRGKRGTPEKAKRVKAKTKGRGKPGRKKASVSGVFLRAINEAIVEMGSKSFTVGDILSAAGTKLRSSSSPKSLVAYHLSTMKRKKTLQSPQRGVYRKPSAVVALKAVPDEAPKAPASKPGKKKAAA